MRKFVLFLLMLCLLFGCSSPKTQEPINKQLIAEQFFAAMNSHDESALDALLAPNAEYVIIDLGSVLLGKAKDENSYLSYMLDLETSYEDLQYIEDADGVTATAKTTNAIFSTIWQESYQMKDTFVLEFDTKGKITTLFEYYNAEKSNIDILHTSADVGITFKKEGDTYVIASIDPASSAVGILQVGDKLIAIDGIKVADMKRYEISVRLAGKLDTSARITYQRDGEEKSADIIRVSFPLLTTMQ